jgi:large subunit ribosomal protein L18e
MKRTGTTNAVMQETIVQLSKQNAKLWKRLAKELDRPTRSRREVNLSRIQRFAKDNDVILVPGKVLSTGVLQKKVNVAAWNFSAAAMEKIKAAGGKTLSIADLVKANPKGTGVKIIG